VAFQETTPLFPDSSKRFWTSYSVWGVALDVDALLRSGRPIADAEVWRRGDYNPLGGGALTAGLSMEIYSGWSEKQLQDAIATFLTRETELLKAARSQETLIDHSSLTTFVSVASNEGLPVGLSIPPSVAKMIGDAGVSWVVTASVFPASRAEGD
jgi:hypothetical protein